jgi:hypothetical protein
MRHAIQITLLAASLALPGCIADGWYIVRGKVSAESAGAPTPLSGAAVAVRPRAGDDWQGTAKTSVDGSYTKRYWFGGMFPFWLFMGDGDPQVVVSAPGHQTKVIRLKDGSATPGVTRHACNEPGREKSCFALDVTLEPLPAAAPSPAVPETP